MEVFDIGAGRHGVARRRERHRGRKLLGLQGAEPGGLCVVLLVEAMGLDRSPVGILGVHGDHAPLQIDQQAQRIQVIGVHILVHDLADGIIFDLGAIPGRLPIEHLIEPEGLHVAVAFEEVAVDFVGDALGHRLEACPDRVFDGQAGVVRDQPDGRHRHEAEEDEQRGQFRGEPPVAERVFYNGHDRCPFWFLVSSFRFKVSRFTFQKPISEN